MRVQGYLSPIPLQLFELKKRLESLSGLYLEGIFDASTAARFEGTGDDEEEVHQVASQIVLFFAELATPLLDPSHVSESIIMKATSKEVMSDVMQQVPEPYATVTLFLWDLCAEVATNEAATRMGSAQLAGVFGPVCGPRVSAAELKGGRPSMNVLASSKMVAFFRRGIEWRLSGADDYV